MVILAIDMVILWPGPEAGGTVTATKHRGRSSQIPTLTMASIKVGSIRERILRFWPFSSRGRRPLPWLGTGACLVDEEGMEDR
jgi:hypothetical protein